MISSLVRVFISAFKASQFFKMLRFLIENSTEVVVASADASRTSAFTRLGLTDAALLEVVSPETPLLTVED